MDDAVPVRFAPGYAVSLECYLGGVYVHSKQTGMHPVDVVCFPAIIVNLVVVIFAVSYGDDLFYLCGYGEDSSFLFYCTFPGLF